MNPDRNKGGYGESAPTTVSGKLTYDSVYDLHTKTYSNPLPLAGADIIIHFPSKGVTVKTDSSGAYSEPYTVTFTACKMVFEVAYHGSDRFSTASADATYHLDRLHGPCPGT